jgi:hypothetical protein
VAKQGLRASSKYPNCDQREVSMKTFILIPLIVLIAQLWAKPTITPIVEIKQSFTIVVSEENCQSQIMTDFMIEVSCEFELDFSVAPGAEFKMSSQDDLYYEYEYKVDNNRLTVFFINHAWVDDLTFEDGAEAEFLHEVIQYFSAQKVTLDVIYKGPLD